MAAKKVFERFAERELDIDHAAVAEHHDEKGKSRLRVEPTKGPHHSPSPPAHIPPERKPG